MYNTLISFDDPAARTATPVFLVTTDGLSAFGATLTPFQRTWVTAQGFKATKGQVLVIPAVDPAPGAVLVGVGTNTDDPFVLASARACLPPGVYRLADDPLPHQWSLDAPLAWALDAYRFDRYRSKPPSDTAGPRLVLPKDTDQGLLTALWEATTLVRDLVNTPAEDMGPADLAHSAQSLADRFQGTCTVIEGDALIDQNYPLIHRVGRASPRAPRLIDLRWGDPQHPTVTLVGKGVCFDTGGLDLKPSGNMRLMKKDMGGAAHALGLAHLLMATHVPVRLRVLIPAVDNAVSGNAMRPGDIAPSRKGLFVEIGNTDAEGRLILADALTEACSESPDLLVDLATLTGAARVALGPDLPALFTDDNDLARSLEKAGEKTHDPLWRLPLWPPYEKMIESPVADLTNAPESGFAGAITAALFLKAFVDPKVRWAHLDLYAWRPSKRPGQPEGAAAQALRPLYAVICDL